MYTLLLGIPYYPYICVVHHTSLHTPYQLPTTHRPPTTRLHDSCSTSYIPSHPIYTHLATGLPPPHYTIAVVRHTSLHTLYTHTFPLPPGLPPPHYTIAGGETDWLSKHSLSISPRNALPSYFYSLSAISARWRQIYESF